MLIVLLTQMWEFTSMKKRKIRMIPLGYKSLSPRMINFLLFDIKPHVQTTNGKKHRLCLNIEFIFLRAAFGGEIQTPITTSSARPSTSTFTSSMSGVESSTSRSKASHRKPNAAHRKYSKLEDQLILKAVELKGRDWRAVLAFLKRNWEVLGEEGELYRSCDIGDKRFHDRLRKRASTLLGKEKEKWVSLLKFLNVIKGAEWSLQTRKKNLKS